MKNSRGINSPRGVKIEKKKLVLIWGMETIEGRISLPCCKLWIIKDSQVFKCCGTGVMCEYGVWGRKLRIYKLVILNLTQLTKTWSAFTRRCFYEFSCKEMGRDFILENKILKKYKHYMAETSFMTIKHLCRGILLSWHFCGQWSMSNSCKW